jgi:hypothetical protein
LKRKTFNEITSILDSTEWLKDKPEQLMKLLYGDCNTDTERNLIIDMINRVYYMPTSEYIESINIIAEDIIANSTMKDTIIYALAMDRESDSSNLITYNLRVALAERGWLKARVFSTMSKLKDIKTNDKIYLIDEFVGSGQTVKGRYEHLARHIQSNDCQNEINIFSIVAMKHAKKYLETKEIELQTIVDLDKGISSYYEPQQCSTMLTIMEDIEKRTLSTKYEGEDMPTLGYKKSEALFRREGGNTPNNVFPIFWWPERINGDLRDTIMTRAM